jgi:hypothetical protein
MLFISRYILQGVSQAALVAASTAVLALVPLLGWFSVLLSGAAVALVTLAKGYQHGLLTMLIAMLGSAVFAALIFSQPMLGMYFMLAVWMPVWLAASVLRQTVSLALSLLLITGFSLLSLLVMYVLFPGFEELWREPLDRLVQEFAAQSMGQFSMEELKQAQDIAIRLIPGLLASTLLLGTLMSLLLARWWQAVNFNPGGFAREFQALNLGKSAAIMTALIVLVSATLRSDMLIAMALVVTSLYLAQGTALMHAIAARRKLNSAWLYLIYVLMLFLPQMVLLLILAGLADAWLNFRQRVAVKA